MTRPVFGALAWLICAGACPGQTSRGGIDGDYLLKTSWGGTAPFNTSAPGDGALGCHAVAISQVMFFHRLAPRGKVSYRCRNGVRIVEDFAGYAPRWDRIALDRRAAERDPAALRETARFMYATAAIVRKDFGTDQYINYAGDYHRKAVESHFACSYTAHAREVTTDLRDALSGQPDLRAILRAEIEAGRPAGLYYTNREGGGHAVVLDGCRELTGRTYFHANFGWHGRANGWYLPEEDLPPDTREIAVLTIVPQPGDVRAPGAGATRGPRESD